MTQQTFLDRARSGRSAASEQAPPPGEGQFAPKDEAFPVHMARLRQAKRWFDGVYQQTRDPWPPELQDRWANFMARFFLLEDFVRDYYGYQGCVMEPARCDPAGPFLCQSCADVAFGDGQDKVNVVVCTRRR